MSNLDDITKALLSFYPIIAILGSARIQMSDPLYEQARELTTQLSQKGFSILTGAGQGIMSAANLGAQEAKGVSLGLMVDNPNAGNINDCLDDCFYVQDVSLRKQAFISVASALICFPGGLGTLDEFSEFLAINQWADQKKPIFLFDSAFWEPVLAWLHDTMLEDYYVSLKDLDCIFLFDSIEDILAAVNMIQA